MSSKITVQDIADALNLSRTTVSKVLNHSPAVSEATRALVMKKAEELGYHIWNRPVAAEEKTSEFEINHFALVMHAIPGGNHMGTAVIPSMDQELRQEGYSLITCAISDEEYQKMQLPPILSYPQTKAIVCLELFDPDYSRLLCSLGKPVLFIDACSNFHQLGLNANLLLMENRHSTIHMLTSVARRHEVKTMGFVGDADHCLSFRERYEAFRVAAFREGIRTDAFCIQDDDALFGNPQWLKEKLEAMEQLPELFYCANDFLANTLIHALEMMGKRIPEDVMVCGFDGMPSISWPLNQLTTVVTPTNHLGSFAARILLLELSSASPCESATYLRTDVLFRETAP